MGVTNGRAGVEKDASEDITLPDTDFDLFRAAIDSGLRPIKSSDGILVIPGANDSESFPFTIINYSPTSGITITEKSLPENIYVNGTELKRAGSEPLALTGINMDMRKSFALTEVTVQGVRTHFLLRINGRFFAASIESLKSMVNAVVRLEGNKEADELIKMITILLFHHADIQGEVIKKSVEVEIATPRQLSPVEMENLFFNSLRGKIGDAISGLYYKELVSAGTPVDGVMFFVSQNVNNNNWLMLSNNPVKVDKKDQPLKRMVVKRVPENRTFVLGSSPTALLKEKSDSDNAILLVNIPDCVEPFHGRLQIDTDGDVTFTKSDGDKVLHSVGDDKPDGSIIHVFSNGGKELVLRINVLDDKIEINIDNQQET